MSNHSTEKSGFVFSGKHMLAAMVSFFGVIIVVNFTMAMLASGSWTGLVVKNSYVASQKFNESLSNAKAQQHAGYRSDVSYNDGQLLIVLKEKSESVLSVSDLTVEIGRPAFEQADRIHTLKSGTNDAFRLMVELDPGVWALKIFGEIEGNKYRRDIRMFVDSKGDGRIE